jgi:DNA-binding CsgD family transcriptional regulator
MDISNIVLPKMLTRTLDNLPYPFFIREKESTKFIYANFHLAKLVGLKSTDAIIGRIDDEIPASLFDNEVSARLWQNQVRDVSNTQCSISLLEVHPEAIDYPYLTKKFPFYDDNNQCIGMAASGRYLEVYSPNDFVRGKLPGSLLLSKPDDIFTEKECEIIFLKLQGMSAKEISKVFMLSPRTIEHRISNMYAKANVNHSDDFYEFCQKRDLHRYLPQRFLSSKRIGFEGDFFEDEE